MQEEFGPSIDGYLAWCQELGQELERPDFKQEMEKACEILQKYRDVFRMLAKS